MSDPSCPFCRKVARPDELAADELVWAFPYSVALLGPWQFYRGYCVLASRSHARELSDMADGERRAYLDEMCLLARAIGVACRPHKLNYELLGNKVEHPHWHLFARHADDPGRLAPAWIAIAAAENDPEARRRLEGGGRAETTAAIRRALIALEAPAA